MKRALVTRFCLLALALVSLTGTASAYYYYMLFSGGVGAPVKFDFGMLVNKKVPFYISDQGPSPLYPGDSFQAVVSEIRAAAEVWNNVGTSELKLAYGGLYPAGRIDSAVSIDVDFSDDITPGVLALGGPESIAGRTTGAGGPYVPITRSKLLVRRDMSQTPSFGEQFFVTLVHEFGHTLGLQHTLTSSVMSTLRTSAASKASPLGPDDIAAISLLYPTSSYAATIGSIGGRVTLNGSAVNLASVVAISPSNPAISALTNPDGTYKIDGIPPGQYFVYVHPLPPPVQSSGEGSYANIWYPLDSNGIPISPNTNFGAQFYSGSGSGTRDWQQALALPVAAGEMKAGVDFNVSPRSSQAIASVRTYGYILQSAMYVSPAPVTLGSVAGVSLVASGLGLLQSNNSLTPGLSVATLGTIAQLTGLRAYPPPQPYIVVEARMNLGTGPGAKHLLFSTPDDLYVLPSAFTAVTTAPPSINSVTATSKFDASGNRIFSVSGTGLQADTRILFEGLNATLVDSVQPDGSLLVVPPQAPAGYNAKIVALNSDGQSSLFLQPAPPSFSYDAALSPAFTSAAASLTITPSYIPAAADTVIDVQGVNTNFVDGVTQVGFGTSDILVKQVSVISSTHLSVVVTSTTLYPSSKITVTTGLRIISQAVGSQIVATDSLRPGQ